MSLSPINKVLGWRAATLSKKDSGTGALLWILQNIEERCFYRTPLGKTTSEGNWSATSEVVYGNFYSPWNSQKTYGFLIISGEIEVTCISLKSLPFSKIISMKIIIDLGQNIQEWTK